MGKKRWYGSINNRIDEGKNYTGREIKVGDDITMYYWSDRHCYYITKVVDQKHIFVKEYQVCADHSKAGGMGHQEWLYFKTKREKAQYLNSCHLKDMNGKEYPPEDLDMIIEDEPEEWVFRYGKWKAVSRYNRKRWEHCLELSRKDHKADADPEHIKGLARYYLGLDDEAFAKVMNGEEVVKYHPLQPISFGVREYYYDWEF